MTKPRITRVKPSIAALVIRGPFEPEEMAELVALLRQIDERHSDREYEIVSVDPKPGAMEIAEELMREMLPPRDGRKTTIVRASADDRRG